MGNEEILERVRKRTRSNAKYITYSEARERYGLGETMLRKMATDSGSLRKFGKAARINVEIFDAYAETFLGWGKSGKSVEITSCVNYNYIMIVRGSTMETEKRRRGRPKTNAPIKDRRVTFRMEETEYQKLKDSADSKGLTVTEAIEEGIRLFHKKG